MRVERMCFFYTVFVCKYVCWQCLTACNAVCWQLMRFGNRIASGNHHSHSGSGANFYCRLPQNARTAHKWLSFVVTKFTVFHVDAVNCSGVVHGYVVNIVANKVERTTGCCFACCRIFDDSHFHTINSDASMFSIPKMKMKICTYKQWFEIELPVSVVQYQMTIFFSPHPLSRIGVSVNIWACFCKFIGKL